MSNLKPPQYGRNPLHVAHQKVQFDAPITNANRTEPYKPPEWRVRPGGSDHLRHKSRGIG